MPAKVCDEDQSFQLRKLTVAQVRRVDRILEQIGDFGSVKLVVEKGAVKFVEVTVSKRL